jgi:transcription elongation factor Elf1
MPQQEVKKKRITLRSVFKCVQCNNDDTVECRM